MTSDQADPSAPEPITVFLLDDHEIVRRGIKDLLESAGDIVVIGESGLAVEATSRIPALRPDVAIQDGRLPDGSGIDVCRDIRLDESLATTPVLMVTSRSTSTDLHLGIAAGATSMLTKPFTLRKFADRVRDLLAEGSMASA